MVSVTPGRRKRSRRGRVGRRPRRLLNTSLLVPLALGVVIYALALPHALSNPLVAGGVAGLLCLIGLVAAIGMERSSTVMLMLAFLFSPLTNFSLGLKPLVFASAFFAIAFLLALPRLAHRPLRLPSSFLIGSVLFSVMGFISIPLAISAADSAVYLVTAIVALIAFPIAVAWMAPTQRQIYSMVLLYSIGTAASCLYGLPGYTYRNYGFTYHPVALGYTCMLALAFVPFLLASKVRGRWIVVPPLAVIALVGVWTSGSRTGLVVLVALGLVIPVFERSIRLGLLVAAGIVSLLPVVFTYDPTGNDTSAFSRLLGTGGAQNSDNTRLSTLRDGFEQIQQSPIFGNGYSIEHTYVIHNLYVQVVAAEGFIGLIGLLMMLGALLTPLRKAVAPQRCLAYPVLAVILAGPFQPNTSDHYLGLTLGLAMVAAVGVMGEPRGGGAPEPSEDARLVGAASAAPMRPRP